MCIPSEQWGETPLAVVVPHDGRTIDSAELITFTRERLAHYKCPTSVEILDALPRNLSGRVLERNLRAPWWANQERKI